MAARSSAPVIGALCDSNGKQEERRSSLAKPVDLTIGYRYQHSFRHFRGTHEEPERVLLGTAIHNYVHLLDVGVNVELTPQWSLTASLPIMIAKRDQLYAPRGQYHVTGLGDMGLGIRRWLWRPPTESGGNIALGLSVKLPTGDPDSTSLAIDRNGNPVRATADQSILAGDGSYGFGVDAQAFRRIPFRSMVYFSGSYLFNPRNTNGVATFRRRAGEEVMSVTDQYLFRAGVSRPLPWVKMRGLVGSFGARIEGVPVRDAIGDSDGFRRPGYAISLDPGLMYSHNRYIFSVNVPWAVSRNRKRSVTDFRNGSHGDAAFADYLLLMSISRRF